MRVYLLSCNADVMVQFSAHHISSRGLKYALGESAFEPSEVDSKKYKKTLLNVLTAQDFDSIPLVDKFEGPITSIGRRRLHDGDVEDVFILSPEEVSKMPQESPVIQCIFEVLSNEHHIVFLTDKNEKIQDVVTIGMLTNPIIKDYLTLLIGKLHSEGWNFNKDHLDSDAVFDYQYPVTIHEELIKLDKMVDNPDKSVPSDLEVSTQIVHILSLLQPLKTWDGGPKSGAMISIDYPLKIPAPEYTPGTAGYFAQHPFGAVMENTEDQDVQDLAFRMFAEANNWDYLALKTSNGDYSHLLGSDRFMIEMVEPVAEDTELDELVHLFDEQNRPLRVNYKHSPYPGIITPQDVVFSEHTKTKMMSSFVEFERHTRDTYMYYIGKSDNDYTPRYWLKIGDTQKGPVWREGLKDVYRVLWEILPDEIRSLEPNVIEEAVIALRNSMAHADFQLTPQEQIEHSKLNKYLLYLRSYYAKIQTLVTHLERVNRGAYFNEFAHLFHSEYEILMNPTNNRNKAKKLNYQLRQDFLNLKFIDGVFVLMVANRSVEPAKKIKSILQERNSIWKFQIADDEMSRELRIKADKINEKMDRVKKAKKIEKKKEDEAAKKAEAAVKKKAEAAKKATLDRAKQELIPVLKAEIHEMLKSKYNEQTEISRSELRGQLRSLVRGVRDAFSLTNSEVISMTKLSKGACMGSLGILLWCGIEYTKLTRTDDEGKKTDYIKIINLYNGEEQ